MDCLHKRIEPNPLLCSYDMMALDLDNPDLLVRHHHVVRD